MADDAPAPEPSPEPSPSPTPTPPSTTCLGAFRARQPSGRLFTVGAWLMGIGVVGGGALIGGGLLANSCDAVCIGAGLGAFLLIVGLGFLLAGAIVRWRQKRHAR